jgi:glucose-6-phosphate isomerase, archaeal
MIPEQAPFSTWIDWSTGRLDPDREPSERRLRDMAGYYLDERGADPDQRVYRVYAVPVEETCSEIQCSTTIVEPGRVGDEYFMTKGHYHVVRDRSEIYLGIRGEGRLVLATEDGRHTVEPILPGVVSYVPGGWAHRSVNVGEEPLIFFAAYVGDAGHDYSTIERRGFPVRIMSGPDGPRVVEQRSEQD